MTELTFDPYATLGVPRGADAARVRDAYRRLARENHPDLTRDRRSTERMQRINRAWEVLSNPSRRAGYDADAASARAPRATHWAGNQRRSERWAPPPRTWSTSTSAATATAAYVTDDGEGPSWRAVVGVLVALVFLGPILFIGLPVPFFGLLAFLALGLAGGRRA